MGGGRVGSTDTFANEYRIRIQHFSIDTFWSIDTFDNPSGNAKFVKCTGSETNSKI